MIPWPVLLNRLGDLDFYLCHLSFSGALLIPFDFFCFSIRDNNLWNRWDYSSQSESWGRKLHKSFGHRERGIIWGHLQPPPVPLVAIIDKREAGNSEWNGLWITFPLFLSPWSAPVVTGCGRREHNFSKICALQHCSRLVLGKVMLPLNRAELNEGGDARSEQRVGIFDPILRHFQLRDMLL